MATKSTVKKGTAPSQKKAPAKKAVQPAATKQSTSKAVKQAAPAKPAKSVKPAKSAKPEKPAKSAKTGKIVPSHEEISRKAHELYLERIAKGVPGNSDSDWHRALEILQGSK